MDDEFKGAKTGFNPTNQEPQDIHLMGYKERVELLRTFLQELNHKAPKVDVERGLEIVKLILRDQQTKEEVAIICFEALGQVTTKFPKLVEATPSTLKETFRSAIEAGLDHWHSDIQLLALDLVDQMLAGKHLFNDPFGLANKVLKVAKDNTGLTNYTAEKALNVLNKMTTLDARIYELIPETPARPASEDEIVSLSGKVVTARLG